MGMGWENAPLESQGSGRKARAQCRHLQSWIRPCGAGSQALWLLVAEQFPHQQIFVVC